MLSSYLEQVLVQHCAPTLLGAKSANLVSLSLAQLGDWEEELALCNRLFGAAGLTFRQMCYCKQRVLLLVYRRQLLEARLMEPNVHNLLLELGYPASQGVEELLACLERRMGSYEVFPHEIGLFLDYPVGDVLGFIRHEGAGGKLCRYWKVYEDVEAAKERFACYDTCRCCLQRLLALGQSISTLLAA